jgi:hypothetical protein
MIPVTEPEKKDAAAETVKDETGAQSAASVSSSSEASAPATGSKSAPNAPVIQAQRQEVGQLVDINYALWLATVATSLMAIACLIANGAIYLIDVLAFLKGSGAGFGNALHFRLFELTALFSVAALAAHFLRLRMDAMSKAAYMVPLPTRIVANPPGGDAMSKFECSCKVTLAIDKPEPLEVLKLKLDVLNSALSNAFVVAVTDPVIRFSKVKMEQTLKVAAHHVLGDGVSGVVISDIKQRRVPLEQRQTKTKPVSAEDTPVLEAATAA